MIQLELVYLTNGFDQQLVSAGPYTIITNDTNKNIR
jgi:hypothetical protein